MAKKTAAKSKATGKIAFKKKASAKTHSATSKKITAKKASNPAAEHPKTVVKSTTAFKTPLSKTGILTHIAENTGCKKADVKAVIDSLENVIECHISSKGSAGTFSLPGLFKIQRINKPAKKARKGINPFTGEEMEFKAKPAHSVVKVRALKKLKDMVV